MIDEIDACIALKSQIETPKTLKICGLLLPQTAVSQGVSMDAENAETDSADRMKKTRIRIRNDCEGERFKEYLGIVRLVTTCRWVF